MIEPSKESLEIGHVGYIVDNLEINIEKYKQILGIDNFVIYEFKPKKAYVMGREIENCILKIAMGSLQNGFKVELIKPVLAETPHAEFINKIGPDIHHIAFYVDNYDEWIEYFRKKNAIIYFEAEVEDNIIGYRRSFYANFKGLAGTIEISEKPKMFKKSSV